MNMLDTTKTIKNKWQPKNVKPTLPSSIFGKRTNHALWKSKNQKYRVCNIIIDQVSYSFGKPDYSITNK